MIRPSDETIKKVIANAATPEEAKSVAAWFASPEGQEKLGELIDCDIEKACNEKNEAHIFSSGEILSKIESQIRLTKRKRILLRIAAVLLPLIAIAALTLAINSRVDLFSAAEYAELKTKKGERLQVAFQDGSIAYLNSESSLRFPTKFGLTSRTVHLSGEAFFEVKPNRHRPFLVIVNQFKVKVLGTSFDVKAYPNENIASVSLEKGKVNIETPHKTFSMLPEEKFTYDKNRTTGHIVKSDNIHRSSLWKENVISLKNTPMSDVITILSRWYNATFAVKDPDVLKYSFTLTADKNATIKEVLSDLEMLAPIKFRKNENTGNISVEKK